MKYYSILLFFIAINLLSCQPYKKRLLKEMAPLNNAAIELVNCLNTKDLACTKNLYHPNFKSLAPPTNAEEAMKIASATIENLEKNNYSVQMNIKELEAGNSLGFVVSDWYILEEANNIESAVVFMRRMDTWKILNNKWKLYRTVFYKEQPY